MSEEIEAIIRDLHYHGQRVRDEWFDAYSANLGRLRASLLEAAEFGREFRHLIPEAPQSITPQPPPVPEHDADTWSNTFGRIPGQGDPRPPGEG